MYMKEVKNWAIKYLKPEQACLCCVKVLCFCGLFLLLFHFFSCAAELKNKMTRILKWHQILDYCSIFFLFHFIFSAELNPVVSQLYVYELKHTFHIYCVVKTDTQLIEVLCSFLYLWHLWCTWTVNGGFSTSRVKSAFCTSFFYFYFFPKVNHSDKIQHVFEF